MNKLAIIPIFFLTMCGTAPITDPPAHAQEVDDRDLILVPNPLIPREQLKGEIDIYEPMHWHQLNMICLLYTSPSPRDRQKSRMPSSA